MRGLGELLRDDEGDWRSWLKPREAIRSTKEGREGMGSEADSDRGYKVGWRHAWLRTGWLRGKQAVDARGDYCTDAYRRQGDCNMLPGTQVLYHTKFLRSDVIVTVRLSPRQILTYTLPFSSHEPTARCSQWRHNRPWCDPRHGPATATGHGVYLCR